MLIEIDIDGTVADIFTPAENIIKTAGYTNFSFNNVLTYEAKNEGIGCPRVVMTKCLCNPEIYSVTQPYKGSIEFVSWLLSHGVNVVFNSKSYNEKLNKAKEQWLRIFQNNVKTGKFQYCFDNSVGAKRMLEAADVVLEDCLDNLGRSKAETKILMKRHHNRPENNVKYKSLFEELHAVDNFEEAKSVLQEIYPEVFRDEKSL